MGAQPKIKSTTHATSLKKTGAGRIGIRSRISPWRKGSRVRRRRAIASPSESRG